MGVMSQSGVSVRKGRKESVCSVNRNTDDAEDEEEVPHNGVQGITQGDESEEMEDGHLVIGCRELHKEMSRPAGLRGEHCIIITTRSRCKHKSFLFLCNIL